MIPFMDREQRRIGFWFTDGAGSSCWAVVGLVYGGLTTALCVASSLLFPVRELFSGIESQAFFDLVNPATLLLLLFVGLYFVVLKATGSTRSAAIATFCAFIICLHPADLYRHRASRAELGVLLALASHGPITPGDSDRSTEDAMIRPVGKREIVLLFAVAVLTLAAGAAALYIDSTPEWRYYQSEFRDDRGGEHRLGRPVADPLWNPADLGRAARSCRSLHHLSPRRCSGRVWKRSSSRGPATRTGKLFEAHPLEEFGCTSCHAGQASG